MTTDDERNGGQAEDRPGAPTSGSAEAVRGMPEPPPFPGCDASSSDLVTATELERPHSREAVPTSATPPPDPPAPATSPTAAASRGTRARRPPRGRVVLAMLGTPVLIGLTWAMGYAVADAAGAPSGDTTFAWLPLALGLLVPLVVFNLLVGVAGAVRPWGGPLAVAKGSLGLTTAFALVFFFVVIPGWGQSEGFPLNVPTVAAMGCAAAVSALPVLLLLAAPDPGPPDDPAVPRALPSAARWGIAVLAAVMCLLLAVIWATHRGPSYDPSADPYPADEQCSAAETALMASLLAAAGTDELGAKEAARLDGRCLGFGETALSGEKAVAALRTFLSGRGYAVRVSRSDAGTELQATGPGGADVAVLLTSYGPSEPEVVSTSVEISLTAPTPAPTPSVSPSR